MTDRLSARISILWFPLAIVVIFGFAMVAMWAWYISMPGVSVDASPTAVSAEERELAGKLRGHVGRLATDIGERHLYKPGSLSAAANYIEGAMLAAGIEVTRQPFSVNDLLVNNVVGTVRAQPPTASLNPDTSTDADQHIFVIGAHYDSIPGTPGADDNASGVAVLIELARRMQSSPAAVDIQFVAFVNEEAPYFGTGAMGSVQYVDRVREQGISVLGMFSLEMLGYFSANSGTQRYPLPLLARFYPDTGNFVAFVGNAGSRQLVRAAVDGFRNDARIPSEGIAAPQIMGDIARSDNWSFWQYGIPALMVTDTANFRNPHYHHGADQPDTLDYVAMARIVKGLESATRSVVREARGARWGIFPVP